MLFVFVQALSASSAIHHFVHHDSDQPSHQCAATLLSHGQVTLASVEVSVSRPVLFVGEIHSPSVPFVVAVEYRLLPALSRAKAKGKQAACINNMRQIGLAMRMYADDSEGLLPTTTHGGATNASWIYQFSGYVGNVDRIRLCPADPKAEQRVAAKAASYTQNEYTSVDLVDPFGRPLESFRKLDALPRPSDTMTTFEISDTAGVSIFNDPLTIQLKRVEGPGHFIVWQSTTLGEFDIKMDTRDGIGPNDKLTPFVGGHEHHNWGFTTSGVYRVYFQASGVRVGQTTNTYSAETPFTFYVLPLKPFDTWQATNWPCECRSNIIAASANPDADPAVNVMEYALGTNPKFITAEGWPAFSIVTTNGQQYGALTFTRVKAATDCVYEVVAASSLTATNWQVLTNVFSVADQGTTEQVTIRDSLPFSAGQQRFYRLRVRLQ